MHCSSARIASFVCLCLIVACSGSNSSNLPAPATEKVKIFFPKDGRVQGRGNTGSAPSSAKEILVSSYPTGATEKVPVAADRSFDFSIRAFSLDTIEIVPVDADGTRGQSLYLRVPAVPIPRSELVCCRSPGAAGGFCTLAEDRVEGLECPPEEITSVACMSDRDCGRQNGEIIKVSTPTVSVPNEKGRVVISGTVDSPGALVRLENRALGRYGTTITPTVRSILADEFGNYSFQDVAARGDDELVLKAFDLIGYRSPEVAVIVPSAKPGGIDVLSGYAIGDRYTKGPTNVLAVRVHVAGADGRGLCPPSSLAPQVCAAGGLMHEHLEITNATHFDNRVPLRVTPIAPTAMQPAVVGTQGDILRTKQDIVLVIDQSAAATANFPGGAGPTSLARAAAGLLNQLRARDRVGIVTFGSEKSDDLAKTAPREALSVRGTPDDPEGDDPAFPAQRDILVSLDNEPRTGDANVFEAVRVAQQILNQSGEGISGSIIVFGGLDDAKAAKTQEADIAMLLDEIRRNGHLLYFIGAANPIPTADFDAAEKEERRAANRSLVEAMTDAAGGRTLVANNLRDLQALISDVAGLISGAFVLLYRLDIDAPDGQLGSVVRAPFEFTISTRLPGQPRVFSDRFYGEFDVELSPGGP